MTNLQKARLKLKQAVESKAKLMQERGGEIAGEETIRAKYCEDLAKAEAEIELSNLAILQAKAEEDNGELNAEVSGLASQCRLSRIVNVLLSGANVDGAEKELYSELKLDEHGPQGGLQLPWQLLEPQAVDAGTSAPTKVAVRPVSVVGRVFGASVARRLGVSFHDAPMGSASYLVLSAGVNPENKADVAIKDSEAATLALTTLEPIRLSAAYNVRTIDINRVPDFEQNLRADLSRAAQNAVDKEVISGDGNAPNVSGLITALTDPTVVNAESTFANYVAAGAGGVDGKLADSLKQIVMAVAPDAYVHAHGELAANTAITAGEWLSEKLNAFIATSHLPAVAVTKSTAIQYRMGDGAVSAVSPMWTPELIVDPYTEARKGLRRITLLWHWNFKVLREDAHRLVQFQIA